MALRRISLLIVLAACVAGFTENEIEVGRQSSQKAEDELWSCLQAQDPREGQLTHVSSGFRFLR